MKRLFLVLLLLLLCGCENKVVQYMQVSDVVVGLFNNSSYDYSDLNDYQQQLLDDYLDKLSNPEINVSDYIIYNDNYRTTAKNSSEIYLKDNMCFVRYNDIKFDEPFDVGESMAKLVCNGYEVILLYDTVNQFLVDYENPKYNYLFLGYYEDDGYNFVYRSYYDGSGLIVSIDDTIEVKFEDTSGLELKTVTNSTYEKYILPSIILLVVILGYVFLSKKYRLQ